MNRLFNALKETLYAVILIACTLGTVGLAIGSTILALTHGVMGILFWFIGFVLLMFLFFWLNQPKA